MKKFCIATIAIVLLTLIPLAKRSQDFAGVTPPPLRQFEFTYDVHVPAVSPGTGALRLWIPVPVSNSWQEISDLKIESPVKYRTTRDAEYGNRYAYFEVKSPQADLDVHMNFRVVRHEHRVNLVALAAVPAAERFPDPMLQRFLKPDHLVPLDGTIGDISHAQLDGAKDNLAKARRAYEYVIANMKYDKTGEGWGHGDAIWACTAKRGNCTDFHSLFIGMVRAAGVPAKFEIGFPLPADKTSGDIPGYHCWAEFYLDGAGWVPVDASEAWKHPDLHEYYFGAHDANRVQFTTGRDIRLSPPQQGDPLNYSVYPYAEAGGKALGSVTTHFAFRDISPDANKTAEVPAAARNSGR
ncbi:MAG: transglutaminase domain-containing protein [Candidatus Acidiferrales bacterium]